MESKVLDLNKFKPSKNEEGENIHKPGRSKSETSEKESPSEKEARLLQLQRLIERGHYQPDANKTAEAILKKAQLIDDED
jgi:anti-sigma28 factor (negative regulator of flagellin synthesis)